MSRIMKGLKFVGLGVAIWGLSLLWPEVNLMLTPPTMMGVVLGLGAAALLVYVLSQLLDQGHDRSSDGAGQVHLSPMIPTVLTPQEYLTELADPVS
jgi:uncharacterized membrane protein